HLTMTLLASSVGNPLGLLMTPSLLLEAPLRPRPTTVVRQEVQLAVASPPVLSSSLVRALTTVNVILAAADSKPASAPVLSSLRNVMGDVVSETQPPTTTQLANFVDKLAAASKPDRQLVPNSSLALAPPTLSARPDAVVSRPGNAQAPSSLSNVTVDADLVTLLRTTMLLVNSVVNLLVPLVMSLSLPVVPLLLPPQTMVLPLVALLAVRGLLALKPSLNLALATPNVIQHVAVSILGYVLVLASRKSVTVGAVLATQPPTTTLFVRPVVRP
ncbi:hypothetical protein PQX77_010103, partial [Marasmius sp. AFHP31]